MRYYFAYGSNLLRSQMEERCPEHQFHCVARLADYRFLINERGVATITPSDRDEDSVYGVVYLISQDDETTLDRREGVTLGCYNKYYLSVCGPDGMIADTLVYVDEQVVAGQPRCGYMDKIRRGAADFHLPLEYQNFLASFDCHDV